MVLQFQRVDAAGPPLGLLLLGQPGVLIVEPVAQGIELGIDAVVDQAALREAEGWGVEQLVAQLRSQGRQFRPGSAQGCQRWTGGAGTVHQGRQLGQPLQAVGQGYEITR